jgi:hypothetical protein
MPIHRSGFGRIAQFAAAVLILSIAWPSIVCSQNAPSPQSKDVILKEFASDGSNLTVKDSAPNSKAQMQLEVADAGLKDRIKKLHGGDWITITHEGSGGKNALKEFSIDTIDGAGSGARFVVLLLSGVVCFLLYYFLSGLKPLDLILGQDNRYSNSKFQTVLWFGIVVTCYLAVSWIRFDAVHDLIGNINIPKNLLLLSGMSAFTYAAAKGITTSKVNAAKAAGKGDVKPSAGTPSLLMDLTHDDGQPATAGQGAADGQGARDSKAKNSTRRLDLGDTQMVMVTLLAVAVYVVVIWNFLGAIPKTAYVDLPDVDSTILATFGLGQGAYLTKKAVGDPSKS